MHKIQMYENLRDMLEREVKEIEKKNDLDPQSLENIYKLTCAIKNVDKIMMKEEGQMDGMSNGRRESMNYGMNYGTYGNGRYSEDNFRYSPNRGRNSYENHYGYSRDSAKDSMVNRLMKMADDSMNEHDRMAIMDCVDKIR